MSTTGNYQPEWVKDLTIAQDIFKPIVKYIIELSYEPAKNVKYIKVFVPPFLQLDTDTILKYFENNATLHFERHKEGTYIHLSGNIKSDMVFTYIKQELEKIAK